jgi:ABC-type multidrug transport system fused ATPase/permease subunit
VVLKDGIIIDIGTHQELIERNTVYMEFYNSLSNNNGEMMKQAS